MVVCTVQQKRIRRGSAVKAVDIFLFHAGKPGVKIRRHFRRASDGNIRRQQRAQRRGKPIRRNGTAGLEVCHERGRMNAGVIIAKPGVTELLIQRVNASLDLSDIST